MSRSRIVWIDYAKAFAIVLIVASHIQHRILKMELCSADGLYSFVDAMLYSFHVPLFFFLSGLFFRPAFRKHGFKTFLANKVRTILYPFAVWSVLQTSVEIVLSRVQGDPLPLIDLLRCLYYPRAHFWFLYALFFMSVGTALIHSICPRRSRLLLVPFALLVFFSSIFFDFGPFADTAKYFIFFAAGVAAEGLGFISKIKDVGGRTLAFALVQFSVLEFVFIRYGWHSEWYGHLLLAASGIILAVAVAKAFSSRKLVFLGYVGAKTLPIYVAHVLAAYPAMLAMQLLTGWSNVFLYATIGMLAGVFPPLLLDRLAYRLGFSLIFELPRARGRNPARNPD